MNSRSNQGKYFNRRGNGSISIIVIMMLIMLFLVLPLVSMIYENYYVSIITREVVDASYSAISSTFDSINVGNSTKNKLVYDSSARSKFESFLKFNLILDENSSFQNEKFSNLEIVSFKSLYAGDVDDISLKRLDNQIIHINMKLKFNSMFLFLEKNSERVVDIHFDFEVPIDN